MRRERLLWAAAVALLATSLAWLAVVNVALVLTAHGAALAVAWKLAVALARAAWTVASGAWPVFPAALIGAGMILTVANGSRRGTVIRQGARHV